MGFGEKIVTRPGVAGLLFVTRQSGTSPGVPGRKAEWRSLNSKQISRLRPFRLKLDRTPLEMTVGPSNWQLALLLNWGVIAGNIFSQNQRIQRKSWPKGAMVWPF